MIGALSTDQFIIHTVSDTIYIDIHVGYFFNDTQIIYRQNLYIKAKFDF